MTQVTNASRRARGLRRLEVWLLESYVARLDKLCVDSGYSRAEQVQALIDRELTELEQSRKR